MARYIDADKVADYIASLDKNDNGKIANVTINVDDFIADVQEVRHGKWVEVETEYDIGNSAIYECSLCGRKIGCDRYPTKRVAGLDYPIAVTVEELYPYCHCGAKMDEEVE